MPIKRYASSSFFFPRNPSPFSHLRRIICTESATNSYLASHHDDLIRKFISIFTSQPFPPGAPNLKELAPKLTNKVVETVLGRLKSWRIALGFFNWASNQNGYRHDIYAYNAMASILSRARQNAPLRALVMEIVNSRCSMSPGALGFLVRCLGNAGLFVEAVMLFDQVKMMGLCVPNSYSYNCLLEALSKSKSIELLEVKFKEMSDLGCRFDKYTLTPLLQVYCNTGKFDRALNVFSKICDQGWVDEHVLSILVVSFSKWGEIDKAFELIERMEEQNVRLNEKTFIVLIHGFVREDRVDKALQLFIKMRKMGFPPQVSLYDVMIGGLCKNKELEKALSLYVDMKGLGMHPDDEILKKLISSFCEEGELTQLLEKIGEDMDMEAKTFLHSSVLKYLVDNDSIEKAYKLLCTIMRDPSTSNLVVDGSLKNNKKGIPLDAISFSTVINGLLKANKLDTALTLFEDMLQTGFEGNVTVYNNLIEWLCKAGRLEESCKILRIMEEAGCEPTQFTLNSIFGCLSKRGDVAGALDLLRKMRICGIVPWIKNSTLLVKELCARGRTVEAYKFLNDMVQEGFLSDIIPYSAVIEGFMKIQEVDQALALFQDICACGYHPDVIAYNIVIKGLCQAKRVAEAVELLNEMALKGLAPSVVTYNFLIDGCCKSGEVDESMLFLSRMLREEVEPNEITYTILLNGLCAAGRPDDALLLWNEMRKKVCAPNRINFLALIHGLCQCSRPKEALEFFHEMEQKNLESDTSVHVILISAFLSDANISLAFELFEEMVRKEKLPNSLDKNCLIIRDAIHKFLEDSRTSSFIINLILEGGIPAVNLSDIRNKNEHMITI